MLEKWRKLKVKKSILKLTNSSESTSSVKNFGMFINPFACISLVYPGEGWGGHGPSPGPVKISHKKDDRQRRPLRFHVSRPLTCPLDLTQVKELPTSPVKISNNFAEWIFQNVHNFEFHVTKFTIKLKLGTKTNPTELGSWESVFGIQNSPKKLCT